MRLHCSILGLNQARYDEFEILQRSQLQTADIVLFKVVLMFIPYPPDCYFILLPFQFC